MMFILPSHLILIGMKLASPSEVNITPQYENLPGMRVIEDRNAVGPQIDKLDHVQPEQYCKDTGQEEAKAHDSLEEMRGGFAAGFSQGIN